MGKAERNEQRVLNSVRNMATSAVLQTVLGILAFVERTIFIRCLSIEYLGLNSLFSNILNVLSMAELGISSAIAFALYKPIAENNYDLIKSYMSFFKKAYRVIGSVILAIGIILSPFINLFLENDQSIENASYYFLIYLFGVGLTYFYSYKQILIEADQKKYINQLVICFGSILRVIVQLIAISITHDYGVYIFLYLVFNVGKNIVLAVWADRLYPYLKNRKVAKLETRERKSIVRNIKALSLHKFGEVAIGSIDSLLISLLVDLRTLGLYANYQIITNALKSAMRVFYSSMGASIGNMCATEDRKQVYSSFVSLDFANYFISSVITVLMFALIQTVMKLWLGAYFVLNTNGYQNIDGIYVSLQDTVTNDMTVIVSYSNNTTFKSVNNVTKQKVGFTKGVLIPFLSGIVGASLVVGGVFGVTEVRTKLMEITGKNTSAQSQSTTQNQGQVNATAVSLTEYSDTAIGTALELCNRLATLLPTNFGLKLLFLPSKSL